MSQSPFGMLPVSLMNRTDITPSEKLTLLALSSYSDINGKCWPSYAVLAERIGMERRSVIRVVQGLEEKGLIAVQRRADDEKGNQSNVFVLIWVALSQVVPSEAGATSPVGTEDSSPSDPRDSSPSDETCTSPSDEMVTRTIPIRTYQEDLLISDAERATLEVLQTVPGYAAPFDIPKELAFLRVLATEFPDTDLSETVKKWRVYKMDVPLTKGQRPRSQLRMYLKKGREWDSPKDKDRLSADEYNERLLRETALS